MSPKLFRGLLNAIAIELIVAWAVLSFFVDWAGWLVVAAMGLFLTTGYAWFCEEMRELHQFRREGQELDDHLASTVTHTPATALTVIEGGRDPDWRDDRRPTWDTDIFGAPD